MERAHRDLLQSHNQELRDMSVTGDLLAILFQNFIITVDDKTKIRRNEAGHDRGNVEQADMLLDLLPRCGEKAFKVFCDALAESTSSMNRELAALLRPGDSTGHQGPYGFASLLTPTSSRTGRRNTISMGETPAATSHAAASRTAAAESRGSQHATTGGATSSPVTTTAERESVHQQAHQPPVIATRPTPSSSRTKVPGPRTKAKPTVSAAQRGASPAADTAVNTTQSPRPRAGAASAVPKYAGGSSRRVADGTPLAGAAGPSVPAERPSADSGSSVAESPVPAASLSSEVATGNTGSTADHWEQEQATVMQTESDVHGSTSRQREPTSMPLLPSAAGTKMEPGLVGASGKSSKGKDFAAAAGASLAASALLRRDEGRGAEPVPTTEVVAGTAACAAGGGAAAAAVAGGGGGGAPPGAAESVSTHATADAATAADAGLGGSGSGDTGAWSATTNASTGTTGVRGPSTTAPAQEIHYPVPSSAHGPSTSGYGDDHEAAGAAGDVADHLPTTTSGFPEHENPDESHSVKDFKSPWFHDYHMRFCPFADLDSAATAVGTRAMKEEECYVNDLVKLLKAGGQLDSAPDIPILTASLDARTGQKVVTERRLSEVMAEASCMVFLSEQFLDSRPPEKDPADAVMMFLTQRGLKHENLCSFSVFDGNKSAVILKGGRPQAKRCKDSLQLVARIVIDIDLHDVYEPLVEEAIKRCLQVYLKRNEKIEVIVKTSGCTELLVALTPEDIRHLYDIAFNHPPLLAGIGVVSVSVVGRPIVINVQPPSPAQPSRAQPSRAQPSRAPPAGTESAESGEDPRTTPLLDGMKAFLDEDVTATVSRQLTYHLAVAACANAVIHDPLAVVTLCAIVRGENNVRDQQICWVNRECSAERKREILDEVLQDASYVLSPMFSEKPARELARSLIKTDRLTTKDKMPESKHGMVTVIAPSQRRRHDQEEQEDQELKQSKVKAQALAEREKSLPRDMGLMPLSVYNQSVDQGFSRPLSGGNIDVDPVFERMREKGLSQEVAKSMLSPQKTEAVLSPEKRKEPFPPEKLDFVHSAGQTDVHLSPETVKAEYYNATQKSSPLHSPAPSSGSILKTMSQIIGESPAWSAAHKWTPVESIPQEHAVGPVSCAPFLGGVVVAASTPPSLHLHRRSDGGDSLLLSMTLPPETDELSGVAVCDGRLFCVTFSGAETSSTGDRVSKVFRYVEPTPPSPAPDDTRRLRLRRCDGHWEYVTRLPSARRSPCVAARARMLVIVGGRDAATGHACDAVCAYDTAGVHGSHFQKLPSLPSTVTSSFAGDVAVQAVVLNDDVVLFGAPDVPVLSLRLGAGEWRQGAYGGKSRLGAGACAFGGHFFATAGGMQAGKSSAECRLFVFNGDGEALCVGKLPPLPRPLARTHLAVLAGRLLIMGYCPGLRGECFELSLDGLL